MPGRVAPRASRRSARHRRLLYAAGLPFVCTGFSLCAFMVYLGVQYVLPYKSPTRCATLVLSRRAHTIAAAANAGLCS